jgi:hypothetical protein
LMNGQGEPGQPMATGSSCRSTHKRQALVDSSCMPSFNSPSTLA